MCQRRNQHGDENSGNAYQASGFDAITAKVDEMLDKEKR